MNRWSSSEQKPKKKGESSGLKQKAKQYADKVRLAQGMKGFMKSCVCVGTDW
jgi:hypothetical protein